MSKKYTQKPAEKPGAMVLDELREQERDELAIELMEKLDKKYNMNNVISLDEYVHEYYNVLTTNEKTECFEIIEIE